MPIYVYYIIAFAAGVIITATIFLMNIIKYKKEHKSLQGLLESERLKKETAQKENQFLIQSGDSALQNAHILLKDANALIKQMDSDILLLQQSNEDTEALLAKGEPAINELKLKLIEANNTIARYKAQYGIK